MFLGSHDHVLDEKGRTSLPKEFRRILGEHKGDPWITAGRHCLIIYPADEFQALGRKLTDASRAVESIRRLQRLTFGMAAPAVVDKQGRILIPPRLRRWAVLDREIVFMGIGNGIEVWDRTRYEADLEQTRELYPELDATFKDFAL